MCSSFDNEDNEDDENDGDGKQQSFRKGPASFPVLEGVILSFNRGATVVLVLTVIIIIISLYHDNHSIIISYFDKEILNGQSSKFPTISMADDVWNC